jgi:phosphoglycerate dehydrogenase-like enzyme
VRVLYTGSGWRPFPDILARRARPTLEVEVWDRGRPLVEVIPGTEVLLPSNEVIGADVIAAADRLCLIQQPAAGVENIDLAAARARGIPVCNAPGANHRAVAEAALLLMLALVRRLPEATHALAAGRIGEPVGCELAGRHLGVVGAGRSGSALLHLAEALGMSTSAVGSRRTDDEWSDFLARADLVSLHCPLSDATRGLMDDRAFRRMKPGAFLINVARGPVVDRGALERALDRGHLGGAGLDVLWTEPWDRADPLFAHPKVIVLPHIAGSTEEALTRVADLCIENARRAARGQDLLHRVA